MANNAYIFGTQPNNLTPQPTSVAGQNNWFTVPNGWYTKSALAYDGFSPASEIVASPNSDFSWPVYYCTIDDSGQQYVFQDINLQTNLTFRPWHP